MNKQRIHELALYSNGTLCQEHCDACYVHRHELGELLRKKNKMTFYDDVLHIIWTFLRVDEGRYYPYMEELKRKLKHLFSCPPYLFYTYEHPNLLWGGDIFYYTEKWGYVRGCDNYKHKRENHTWERNILRYSTADPFVVHVTSDYWRRPQHARKRGLTFRHINSMHKSKRRPFGQHNAFFHCKHKSKAARGLLYDLFQQNKKEDQCLIA